MNEQNHTPLNDDELSTLLNKWKIAVPATLEQRILDARPAATSRRPWWHFALKGSIRLPVPVACCLAILMIALLWRATRLELTCSAALHSPQPAIAAAASSQPSGATVACPANMKC